MNTIKRTATATALLAAPFLAFAQSASGTDDSLTRSQVRQDLIQTEQQGYNPATGDQASYPRDAQAAEARIGVQQVGQAQTSGYGGVMPGTTASGGPSQMTEPVQPAHMGSAPGTKPVYFGQ